jgi:hypothetical protein
MACFSTPPDFSSEMDLWQRNLKHLSRLCIYCSKAHRGQHISTTPSKHVHAQPLSIGHESIFTRSSYALSSLIPRKWRVRYHEHHCRTTQRAEHAPKRQDFSPGFSLPLRGPNHLPFHRAWQWRLRILRAEYADTVAREKNVSFKWMRLALLAPLVSKVKIHVTISFQRRNLSKLSNCAQRNLASIIQLLSRSYSPAKL